MTYPRPGSLGSVYVTIRPDLTQFREVVRAFAEVTRVSNANVEMFERLSDALRYPQAERRRRAARRARLAAKNPASTALWTQYRAKTRRRNRKARR